MLARIWKDPVWASIITTGVTALASYFGGWWPAIAQAFKDAWSFLTSASPISHWGIGLLAFMALPTVVVGTIVVWQSVRPAPASSSLSDFPDPNFLLVCYRKCSVNVKITPISPGNFDHVQLHSHRPQN